MQMQVTPSLTLQQKLAGGDLRSRVVIVQMNDAFHFSLWTTLPTSLTVRFLTVTQF